MADMNVAFTSVRTRSLLPSPLVHGRTYWIEDEGKIIVDWGNGPKEFGGGSGSGTGGPGPEGDAFFVGSYKDPEALKFAHSTASLGSYATVLSTNTVWIWNGSAWEDSGNEPLTVEVIDSITSTRADAALSAAQGKHLGDNIASLDAKVQGIIDGGGTGLVVDAELSKESTNPVQNKVITNAIKTVTGVDVTDPESGVNPDGTPSGGGSGGSGGSGGVVINPDSPIGVYVNDEVAKHNANNSAHGLNSKQWGMLRSLDAFPADEGKHLVIGNRGGVPVFELEENGGGGIIGDVSGIMDGTKVSWVIGLVQTAAFEADDPSYSVMDYVDNNFNPISVTSRYFDVHPSYQFEEEYFGSDVYIRVPKAYWRRMRVPEWKPNAGRFVMFLSPEPLDGFTASPAFMYRGEEKDYFSVGKYIASKNGSYPASVPNAAPWVNVSFNSAESACRGLGDGHHLMSVYEYHELVQRMAMEHKTFAFLPNKYVNKSWRGFENWPYPLSAIFLFLNGIRTDPSAEYEIWDTDGQHRYEAVDGNIKSYAKRIGTLAEGGRFDHLLLPGSLGSGITGDVFYSKDSSLVATAGCYSVNGSAVGGAAGLCINRNPSRSYSNVVFRAAKI